jgi:hypothetical protein
MSGIPLRTLAAMALDGDGQADIMCARLDSRYDTYRQERRTIEHCMQTVPHDGRPPIALRAADTVNGQEVRASERWHGTAADAVTDAAGRPIDRTCYRLVPPASGIGPVQRVPFEAPVSATETPVQRSRALSTADVNRAAMQRLTAALISPADRAALADGTA